MLVDTHCHLDPESTGGDPSLVIERALAAGVGALVAIGVGSREARAAVLALSARGGPVVATVGVHPHDAAGADDALVGEVTALAHRDDVVAVGEVGLDHHYSHAPHDVQDRLFRRFVGVARQVGKPLVIHTRSAPAETLRVLEEEGARDVGGIIHCFSEDVGFARRALDLDFDLSFSGIVTFRSARSVQEAARFVPADRYLVETDAPYLAPVPLRGRPNEPAFIVHTAAFLAALRGEAPEAVAASTTANARRRLGAALDRALGGALG